MIQWIENAEYVFYGPTGSAMLGIYDMAINKNSYLFNGGDSSILGDIYKHKHDRNPQQVIKVLRSPCPFFPCGRATGDKVMACRANNRAACLNEELVINV
jgi:hypothetical protein